MIVDVKYMRVESSILIFINNSHCCSHLLVKCQSHSENAWIMHELRRYIFVSARSVRRVRNSLVDRTWTVSDCKWMCVEGAWCVILSFELLKKSDSKFASVCVIHESAYVVITLSTRDYARDRRRPLVLMRRNWFETAHIHVRPLTPHFQITPEPRSYHVHRGTKALVRGNSRSMRVWTRSVIDSCIGRASNVHGILHHITLYASTCTIFQWFVSDCKWYVRDSCVVNAWKVSDFYLRRPEYLVNFSTHKHSQTQYVRNLWVICAWSAVWLALKVPLHWRVDAYRSTCSI